MLHTVCFANNHIDPCTKLRTFVDVPRTLNTIPVTFINGKYDGPTVLVTSGISPDDTVIVDGTLKVSKDTEVEPVPIH